MISFLQGLDGGQANRFAECQTSLRSAIISLILPIARADIARSNHKMNRPIKNTTATTDHATGYQILHNPRLNKGTAFTEAERRSLGLEGLLPAATSTIELQVARRHA